MHNGNFEVLGLRPFIPSGPDFAEAIKFFLELGFEKLWEADGYAGFSCGSAKFILQDFNDTHFAENLMVRVDVSDLDAWWAHYSAKSLDSKYKGVRIKPPTEFPWGREVNIVDLAGVCWHIGEPH